MIKIYNSLTNKIEEFKPIEEGKLSMYVCGPTVYSDIHIGNSRPVIFFDTVARFFKYLGYDVKYVSNFTDIDDKIIKRAKEEGISEKEVSEKNIKNTLDVYHRLNCLPHYKNPQVTENMGNIIEFIQKLVDGDYAYASNGDVYFDVRKVNEYGILSGQTIDNLLSGVRIDNSVNKHNAIDFTLWKKTQEGVKWDSPWGEGRPGWHTECVVMIDDIFKGKIDIHGGGNDLKFPHHDNEIAQSLCINNHKIANYWMHNGRIDLRGEKMSKSLGNIIKACDLLDSVPYQVYRLMILNVPYRQILNYKDELLTQSSNDYEKIRRSYISLYRKLELNNINIINDINERINYTYDNIIKIREMFIENMSNDFNTANAITSIFELTKISNIALRSKEIDEKYLMEILKCLYELLWVLGIEVDVKPLTKDEIDLINKWNEAKKNKDFALADELRKDIIKRNIEL